MVKGYQPFFCQYFSGKETSRNIMTVTIVNGRKTIERNVELIRKRNMDLWREKELSKRIRGNGWTIFKRLIYDYRNHFGDTKRANKREMPYVDSLGYLYTSKALIAHAEGKSMSNVTVGRWLERFSQEKIDGEVFILEYRLLSRECIKIKLNESFFIMEDREKHPKHTSKPQKEPEKGLDLSKLAKKFNKKHHIK